MSFPIKTMMVVASMMLVHLPAQAEESPLAKPVKDKLICKTETTVGSLIPGPRRCHTRAQWEEHATAGQAIARHMVEDNTGRPPGN